MIDLAKVAWTSFLCGQEEGGIDTVVVRPLRREGEAWGQGYDVLSFKRHTSVQASIVIVTLKLVSKVKGGSTVHEHAKF